MCSRNVLAGVAAIVLSSNGLIAQAQQPAPDARSAARPTLTTTTPPATRRPLMNLLDRAGVAKPLDDARINLYGHVEAGWTYNFDNPDDDLNPFRIFDFEHNEPILNQFDFTIERLVDYRKRDFDIGFRAELI